MADVNISKYRASVVRSGSAPATPGFVVSEGQNPVEPAGSEQNHLPVTINATATGLAITTDQVLSGAGTVGQYIRGDGSLADFPASTGGGSSVSYYLNGSVSQGTIGGVAYKELSKTPILGAGTQFTINADGYIASFLTDAGDPNLLEIPGGNWNFETYFSASSGGGSPTFYVELYKYDGSTFTLIASNSGSPELIAFGTNVNSYFSTLAVPTTALTLTDRLAIRYYVTHSGRTITLHTENNTLCQIITTFTTGLTALNGLTTQVQYFAVGTSGTDFNISSATQTHTFNLPTASASNRGALSSSDWTTFNNKQNALTNPVTGTGTTNYLPKFTGTSSIGNSIVQDAGIRVDIGGDIRLTPSSAVNIQAYTGSVYTNLFYNAASHNWQTSGGATKMFLNSNDNLLIGTTTDGGQRLQVTGTFALRASASGSSATQIPIFAADPSGTTRELVTRTPAQLLSDIGGQAALTNPVTGTGTTNYLPKFTGTSTIGNSQIFDNGTQVGIGLTPNASYGTLQIKAPSGVYSLDLVGRTAGVNGESQITFWNAAQSSALAYLYNSGSNLYIGTGANQPFTLSSGGNFIFGSTSDNGARLQVSGFSRFDRGTLQFTLNPSYALGNVYSQLQSTGALALATGGDNNRLYIDTSGNVGIGTSSPNRQLTISASQAIMSFNATSYRNTTIGSDATGSFIVYDDTAAAYRMVINSGGNVGIGTTSFPSSSYKFIVRQGTDRNIAFAEQSSELSIEAYNDLVNANVPLRIYSSKTQFLNGNVLIGTTTDNGARLQVSGAIYSSDELYLDNGKYLRFRRSSGNLSIQTLGIPSGTDDVRLLTTGDFNILNGSLTNLMTVKNGGNVGIGTSSPVYTLDVRGRIYAGTALLIGESGSGYSLIESTGGNGIWLRPNGVSSPSGMFLTTSGNVLIGTTTDSGARLNVQTSGSAVGGIRLTSATNTNGSAFVASNAGGDSYFGRNNSTGGAFTGDSYSTVVYGGGNYPMGFYTNDTLRMTITSGGSVLIGKTDPNVDVGDGLRVDSDGTIYASIVNAESTYYLRDITNTTYRFRVSGAGTIFATNTTISSISDIRLKENIRDLDKGLETILSLKPRVFDWKNGSGQIGKNIRGFIAQEVEELLPELIDEWSTENLKDGEIPYKSVRMDVIPMLVKAIQELKQEIDTLKN